MERDPAPDHDRGCSRPLDLRPHRPEEALQVSDLRLPGRADDGGQAGTAAGGQHGVFRGPHAGDGQADLPALKPAVLAAQHPLLLQDHSAQGPQGGQMQVDGPGTQLTAARVGQLRHPQPRQQRTQENDGGPHFPHQVLGDIGPVQNRRVHQDGVPLPVHPAAQQAQDIDGGGHVGQVGNIAEHALAWNQQAGGQHGQNAVLRSVDGQGAGQGTSARNLITAHGTASKSLGFGLSYAQRGRLVIS